MTVKDCVKSGFDGTYLVQHKIPNAGYVNGSMFDQSVPYVEGIQLDSEIFHDNDLKFERTHNLAIIVHEVSISKCCRYCNLQHLLQ